MNRRAVDEDHDLPPAYAYHWNIVDAFDYGRSDETILPNGRKVLYQGRTRLINMAIWIDAVLAATLTIQAIGGWLNGTQALGYWLLHMDSGTYGSWGLWGWCLSNEVTTPQTSLVISYATILASRCDFWNSGKDPPDPFFVYSVVSSPFLTAMGAIAVTAVCLVILGSLLAVFVGYRGGGIVVFLSLLAMTCQFVCFGMAVSTFVDLGYGTNSTKLNPVISYATTWAGWGGGMGAGIASCLLCLMSFFTKVIAFRRPKSHVN